MKHEHHCERCGLEIDEDDYCHDHPDAMIHSVQVDGTFAESQIRSGITTSGMFDGCPVPFRIKSLGRKFRPEHGTKVEVYAIYSASGNHLALAWIDPDDYMPVYKMTGSTPDRRREFTF